MSIVIKGMKMPKSCSQCYLMDLSEAIGCPHSFDMVNEWDARSVNCPIIELPDHGKWMAIGNTGLAACECGYVTDRYSIYNYCPNCGAKMEDKE